MSAVLEPRYHADRLLDILLRKGGHLVIFESFADASGTSAPCKVLSVAAFLFEKTKSTELDNMWRMRLDPLLSHVPPHKRYFHMVDFMDHRKPYDKLNEAERLSLRHDLIESASKSVEFAIVCSVALDEYQKMLPLGTGTLTRKDIVGSPFTMCGLWTMRALASYLDSAKEDGTIAFFFEAGDPDQPELCARIREISKSPFLLNRYRYSSHSFVPKQYHHALGAADMMAWEYRRGIEEHIARGSHYPGPFFRQLFGMPIGGIHFSPINLQSQTIAMAVEEANRWEEEKERKTD